MLEFVLYYILLYITHQAKNQKNERIRNFTLCQWNFSNMHIFAALSGCPVVTSAWHILASGFGVETSVKINYWVIFQHIMLEFVLYYILLYITHQAKNQTKMNKLEISHFMQCQWNFSNMHSFAAISGCPVVTSDMTHTDIRLWGWNERQNELLSDIPMSYKHWSSQETYIYLMNNSFLKNLRQVFHGSLSEFRDRHHLWLVFKVIISNAAALTWSTRPHQDTYITNR